MSSPIQLALALAPLGFYLWILGIWQSGRHPRVISGLLDFSLLACALIGILAFGPFGDLLSRLIFHKPDWLDRMVLVSGLGLGATILARRSLHRVVVYHVDVETFGRIMEDLLNSSCGRFSKTLHGFEDRTQGAGVSLDLSNRWGWAVVEAYGNHPEGLIQLIRLGLRTRLKSQKRRSTRTACVFYVASILVMLTSLVGSVWVQPLTRAMLREFMQRIRG